jgi:PAS domain-containing protein
LLPHARSGPGIWSAASAPASRGALDAHGWIPEAAADGSLTWQGFAMDITDAKDAESELRIAAATFETQEGIFITDAQTRIVRVNQAFTTMTGYTAREAIGQTPRLLRSGRHDAEFYGRLREGLARNGFWQGEIWNRRKAVRCLPNGSPFRPCVIDRAR